MNQLVKQENDLALVQDWTPDQLKLITDVVAKNATPNELKLFLYRCKNMGLDPLKPGMVHFIKYNANSPGTIVVGVEGFRSIAARTGKVAGIKRGVNLDEKGKLVSAWCEVYRSDWQHPAREEVPFVEYNAGNKVWNQMPQTMLKKVAECAALRMAFPDDLGGVYESAELDQASTSHQPPPEDGVQSEEYSPKYGRFAKKHLSKCDPVGLREEVEKYEADAKEKGRDPLPWEQEFIEHATPLIEEFEKALAAPLESGAPRPSIKPIVVPAAKDAVAVAKPKITPEPAPVWDKDLPTVTGVVVSPDYDPNAEYVFKGRHSLAGTKVKDVSRSELERFLRETRAWFKKLGKEMTGDALLDATRVDDYLRTSAPDPDFFAGAPS